MIIATFQVIHKLGIACCFWATFLLADISIKVVLKMLFLTLSNVNILFVDKKRT